MDGGLRQAGPTLTHHVSHLYAVYPFEAKRSTYTSRRSWLHHSALARSLRQLERGSADRLVPRVGLNLWARFLDGDQAHGALTSLPYSNNRRCVVAKLKQLDGCDLAPPAAWRRCLLLEIRTTAGRLSLLPALRKWPDGKPTSRSLRAQRQHGVDLAWQGGKTHQGDSTRTHTTLAMQLRLPGAEAPRALQPFTAGQDAPAPAMKLNCMRLAQSHRQITHAAAWLSAIPAYTLKERDQRGPLYGARMSLSCGNAQLPQPDRFVASKSSNSGETPG
jgi:hypothetical protein